MADTRSDKPEVIFLRYPPNNWLNLPPLASSLQNLETSFLLLASRRYASALVSCASAVESSIKAAFKDRGRTNLVSLLQQANSAFGTNAFSDEELNEFRGMRNAIVHQGFSRKDEETSARVLLGTGYPLLEQCYRTFFDYNLKRREEEYGGLLSNLDRHLQVAEDVYLKVKDTPRLECSYCFIPLGHEVRLIIQDSMLSSWQLEVLQNEGSTGDQSWALQRAYKNQLMRESFANGWEFDCSVCGYYETLICELDDTALEKKEVRLNRAVCVQCGLLIPESCPLLVDELCKDQVNEVRPEILKEFGIE